MSGPAPNPYVGLRPFDTDDSHLFFGRTEQITALLESLHHQRFLGVVGSSGCGKSSLIKAGLIPALHGGFLVEDRDEWTIARLTPGDSPLENLASSLSEAFPGTSRGDAKALRREIHTDGIASVCDRLLGSMAPARNLLVLVDQFEEIFTFRGRVGEGGEDALDAVRRRAIAQRQADAADFVRLLLTLSQRPAASIYVVATMRSDFLGDCDLFYGLPEAMNRGRYLVPRLSRRQLTEAIAGPARQAGGEIAGPLVDRLLNELGDRFDRLPVLQHALQRTWQEWRKDPASGPVDVKHYVAAGTLEQALAIHAGEVLESLRDTAKASVDNRIRALNIERAVSAVFQSLTDTDAGGRRVRRAARVEDIASETGLPRELVRAIATPFVTAGFLYVTKELDEQGEIGDRYSISHESLIRQWGTLSRWVADERESRDNYRELVSQAAGKKAGKKGLLRNPDLQFKRRWWEQKAPRRAWAKRYVEREEDFDAAQRFLSLSTRWQRLRWTAGIVSVLTVLLSMGALAAWALTQRNEARRSAAAEKRSADLAEASAVAEKEARAQAEASLVAIKARAEAEANLQLAREREEEARLALAQADAAASEARAQAESNLTKATEARLLAEQKVRETEIANLSARLDPQDLDAFYDSLWRLTSAPDDIAEQVLRRLLASEATASRFRIAGDSIVVALLGVQPAVRMGMLKKVVGEMCVDRYREIARGDIAPACVILLREVGVEGAADPDIERRALAAIEAAINPRDNDFVPAFTSLGDALGADAVARLTRTMLKATDGTPSYRAEGRLDFLAKFGTRLGEAQAREIANTIVKDLLQRPGPLDNPSEFVFTLRRIEALRARLGPDASRQMIDRVLEPPATRPTVAPDPVINIERNRGRFLSFFATQLTAAEASFAGRAVMAGLDPAAPGTQSGYQDLKRLSENLQPSSRGAYANELLTWVHETFLKAKRPSYSSESPAEALYAVRSSLDATRVKELSADLIAPAPDDQKATRLLLLAAVGGMDALATLEPRQLEVLLAGGRSSLSALLSQPPALSQELFTGVRSVVLSSSFLFASREGNRFLDTNVTAPVIQQLTAVEMSAWLDGIPQTPAATRTIARHLGLIGEERGSQLLRWLLLRVRDLTAAVDLSDVTSTIAFYLNRNPGESADGTDLVGRWTRELNGSDQLGRLMAPRALYDLRHRLTRQQSEAIVRLLAGRASSAAPQEVQLLAHFAPMLDSGVASPLVATLWKQFEAEETGDYDKQLAAIALAKLGRFLNSAQKDAVLAQLLKDERRFTNQDDSEGLTVLIPALDGRQVETLRSAAEAAHRGQTGAWSDVALVTALADRLEADARRATMQLLVDSFVPADRRDSPRLEGLATLVPVLGKLDARQQERVLELLTLSLRGGFDRSRNTVPTLVSFSRLRPDARERIVTALLRSLEGRSAMPTESVLAIIAEFTGTPVSRQGLYDLLKWPTLSTVVYTDVVNELARREKTPPDSLLRPVAPAYRFAYLPTPAFDEPATEPDRWALARWEAARTLNLAPLQRPAGFE